MPKGDHSRPGVAADQIGGTGPDPPPGDHRPRPHTGAETGGEPLDLSLDAVEHVDVRSTGNMTIRPGHVLVRGGTAGIEQGRLAEQHKRSVARHSAPNRGLGTCDLRMRGAEMDCPRTAAWLGRPGYGLRERPVHFEDTRAVAILLQFPAVTPR